jgi:hypothetical protein
VRKLSVSLILRRKSWMGPNNKLFDILLIHFRPRIHLLVRFNCLIFWWILLEFVSLTFKLGALYLVRLRGYIFFLQEWRFSYILLLKLSIIIIFLFARFKGCINIFEDSDVHLGGSTIKHSLLQCLLHIYIGFVFLSQTLMRLILVMWEIIKQVLSEKGNETPLMLVKKYVRYKFQGPQLSSDMSNV